MSTKWSDRVKPVTDKFRIAATLNIDATFNIVGSRIACNLLETLAAHCDEIDERFRRDRRREYELLCGGVVIGIGIGYLIWGAS
jgi:hypothetical protein